jgi:hypothetical protein
VISFTPVVKPLVIKEFNADLANSPTPKVKIESIEPDKGPVTGETRVLVRGGPFGIWEAAYPTPSVTKNISITSLFSANLVT